MSYHYGKFNISLLNDYFILKISCQKQNSLFSFAIFCWGRKVGFEIFNIFEFLISVIVDPHMLTSLWMTFTPGFKVVQIKEMNYKDWHPRNQFMHLAINVFGCSHKARWQSFTSLCQQHMGLDERPKRSTPFGPMLGDFQMII